MALVSARVGLLILTAALLLAACAPWQPAAERSRPPEPRAQPRVIESPPTFYRVQRGDTLYSITFRYGLDWRKVAFWNDIEAPYTIRPGQELRMSAPPAPPPRQVAVRETAASERSAAKAEPASKAAPPTRPKKPAVEAPTSRSAAAPTASETTRSVGGLAWQWPTQGRLARRFDPADTRKGIGVAGKLGQDVFAAASGQVVYSGTALIGYGELIIIKHSDKLLSAYGHNRRRLVAEGDRVQRGQKIAEMGRDDHRDEMLHFEIRRNGEPVNPLDYLPKR
ncbi:MAG TPA: peptidoglycan DD-metalloendopeptidase family protein [Wenzhouxiangella sp.]|nr:peptidoglycan DD-metalloendopeptidase family protein [Wenzhouxiangella sp.]